MIPTPRRLFTLAAAAVLALAPVVAEAQSILFRHDGRAGSGTIGDISFTDRGFSIFASGDIGARQSYSAGFFIDHLSARIEIEGIGSFDFVTGTRTFVNNASQLVGFSRAGTTGADLFNGPFNSAFSSWDMTTDIGPIAGNASLIQWGGSPVVTSGGTLVFASSTTAASFTATTNVVPEPSTYALLATGLVSLVVVARRRRSA